MFLLTRAETRESKGKLSKKKSEESCISTIFEDLSSEKTIPTRGVFWIIEGNLTAFPFVKGVEIGVAKSGSNFNHQKLWDHIKPRGCRYPFDFYPRGRVEFNRKGRPIIYMSPHVDLSYVPEIRKKFGLQTEPVIRYDGSRHYRCFIDYEDSHN